MIEHLKGESSSFRRSYVFSKEIQDTFFDKFVTQGKHHGTGIGTYSAKLIAETLGVNLDDVAKFGRDRGRNKREVGAKKEIGIHAIRAGDIVGDHTVIFAGPGERIELRHQAHSRSSFASGAIKAIKFIADAKEAKIYSTREVLDL